MNVIVTIHQLKLPKDVINKVNEYLFYQENEEYFRHLHKENIQDCVNYLIEESDTNMNMDIESHTYLFAYIVDRDDFKKKDRRNHGHSRWYNQHVQIRANFCSKCGNYIRSLQGDSFNCGEECSDTQSEWSDTQSESEWSDTPSEDMYNKYHKNIICKCK